MKHKGYIQPTPQDSPAQCTRWMLLQMHHYWWEVTGVKDVRAINMLTQEIRKEWLETRKKSQPVAERKVAEIVRQICDFFGGEVAESDKQELGRLIVDWASK